VSPIGRTVCDGEQRVPDPWIRRMPGNRLSGNVCPACAVAAVVALSWNASETPHRSPLKRPHLVAIPVADGHRAHADGIAACNSLGDI
jgi:hypothetical protein